jgi:hypothetical protein
MGKLIPNAFNLLVVIYVALGSTACSYGMAIIGYSKLYCSKIFALMKNKLYHWAA